MNGKKEVISSIKEKSEEYKLLFLDAEEEFSIFELIRVVKQTHPPKHPFPFLIFYQRQRQSFLQLLAPQGKSKLLVYTHEKLTNCCQGLANAGFVFPGIIWQSGIQSIIYPHHWNPHIPEFNMVWQFVLPDCDRLGFCIKPRDSQVIITQNGYPVI